MTTANAAKTHCKRGHPFTEANTYVWRGRRCCRECGRIRYREWWQRRKENNAQR